MLAVGVFDYTVSPGRDARVREKRGEKKKGRRKEGEERRRRQEEEKETVITQCFAGIKAPLMPFLQFTPSWRRGEGVMMMHGGGGDLRLSLDCLLSPLYGHDHLAAAQQSSRLAIGGHEVRDLVVHGVGANSLFHTNYSGSIAYETAVIFSVLQRLRIVVTRLYHSS